MGRFAYMLQAQAAVLSYIDLYWILTVGTAMMFFLSFLLKRNDPRAGGHVVVH
jgi:DHA2 family multidrug resistance protein